MRVSTRAHRSGKWYQSRFYADVRIMLSSGGLTGGERHSGVGIKSEGLKEGEQFVRGLVASWGGVWGSGPSKRAFFEGEVSVQVDLGCLDALVAKPERDHGAVHACL